MTTPAARRRIAARLAFGGACVAAFLGAAHLADRDPARAALYRPAPLPAPAVTEPAGPAPITIAVPAASPAPAPVPEPAATDAYAVRSILDIPKPFRHGDWYWDDRAAPPTGRIVVTVDLAAQVLSVFRDGHEIGTAVMIYGADEKPTPLGVFAVSFRKARHVSSLYDAPMPYTLRLTNDGVAIHGSATMRPDAATHGCVGVPVAFAKRLFDVVKLGDTVIVSNGERLDVGQPIAAANRS